MVDTGQPSQDDLIRQYWERHAEVKRLGVIGMAEAGRRLGMSTREIVQAVYDRRIRHVIVHGIPYINPEGSRGVPVAAARLMPSSSSL